MTSVLLDSSRTVMVCLCSETSCLRDSISASSAENWARIGSETSAKIEKKTKRNHGHSPLCVCFSRGFQKVRIVPLEGSAPLPTQNPPCCQRKLDLLVSQVARVYLPSSLQLILHWKCLPMRSMQVSSFEPTLRLVLVLSAPGMALQTSDKSNANWATPIWN